MTDSPLKQASDSQRFIVRQHQAREKKRYVKAVLLLLLAVLAGAAIGVGCTLMYMRGRFHRKPPSPDAVAAMVLGRMREAVPLEAGEEARLRSVLDGGMREIDAIRRESMRGSRAIIDRMTGDVGEVLGPERSAVWEKAKEKHFGKRRWPPSDKNGRHR